MKIEDYELLLQLNEYGTIRATAKKVLISQPALTQRLKFIEKYMGGSIFLRTSKKLVPTPFGEIVLDHAGNVLQTEEEFRQRLAQTEGRVSGTLSIGASSLYSQYFLPELLQSFTKEYPNVAIDLVTGVSEEIRQSAEDYHIAIVRGEPLKDYQSLHLFSDRLYFLDLLPFSKDIERPFIEFKSDPDFQKLIEQWMGRNPSLLVKRLIKVDHFETAKQMMKRGLGMTVLPESIIQEEKDDYEYQLLHMDGGPITRETWACMKSGISHLPQVDAFIKHLTKEGSK